MSKAKRTSIAVKGAAVTILSRDQQDFVSLTDIARYKDAERTDYLISNWLRNRNTIEFLGIWEQLNNPGFNPIEFDGIKKQAGSLIWKAPIPSSSAKAGPRRGASCASTKLPSPSAHAPRCT